MTADHIAVPAEWLQPGALVPVTPETVHTLVQALRSVQAPAEGASTDERLDAIADGYRWDTREGRRAMIRAALAANVQPKAASSR